MDKLIQLFPGEFDDHISMAIRNLDYEFILLHPDIFEQYKGRLVGHVFDYYVVRGEYMWPQKLGEYCVYMIKHVYDNLLLRPQIIKRVLQHPDLRWPWSRLSQNPALTPAVIEQLPNRAIEKLNWSVISERDDLDSSFVRKYQRRLNFSMMKGDVLLKLDSYTVEAAFADMFMPLRFGLDILFKDKFLGRRKLVLEPDYLDDFEVTLDIPEADVTWEYVFSHPDIPWDVKSLFSRLPINTYAISKFSSESVFIYLSVNDNLTTSFIDEYKDECWNSAKILENKSIDIDYALDFAREKLDESSITRLAIKRDDCTWLTIAKHRDINWEWRVIAQDLKNTRVLWDDDIHKYFPEWDKYLVRTILLIMRRAEIPYDVIFIILRMVI